MVIACTVALGILFFVKARFEEKLLMDHFEGYAEYATKVGRFVPGLGKIRLK